MTRSPRQRWQRWQQEIKKAALLSRVYIRMGKQTGSGAGESSPRAEVAPGERSHPCFIARQRCPSMGGGHSPALINELINTHSLNLDLSAFSAAPSASFPHLGWGPQVLPWGSLGTSQSPGSVGICRSLSPA